MIWLVLGVLIWSLVHFIPVLARPFREDLIAKLGAGSYRATFSIIIFLSVALIVYGWRSTPEEFVYQLPLWSKGVGIVFMLASFILLGVSHGKSVLKRVIRHPMLTGLLLWSISHLITNGTTRAIVLFGALGVWAVIQMLLTNSRDGQYIRPDAPALSVELKGLVISLVIFAVVLLLHPYFTGVSVIR